MNEQEKELQLQRLIDGQLDRQQIQALLIQAESDSNLWREIGSAFVEDQLFAREIRAFSAADEEQAEGNVQNHSVAYRSNGADGRRSLHLKYWLAMAALLLAGIWVGQTFQSAQNSRPGNVVVDNQDETPINLVSNQRPHLNLGESGDIPLYTLDEARQMGMTFVNQEVPQETLAELNQQGYDLMQDTRFVSTQTSDGRTVVVPIRSIRLHPGN